MINEIYKENLKSKYKGMRTEYLFERMFKLYKKQCRDCQLNFLTCLCDCIIEAGDISDEIDRRRTC